MPLDALPLVVIDQILELINIPELLALSSTCRSLRPYANRFLYRRAHDIATNLDTHKPWNRRHYRLTHLEMLEDSLVLNPRNAQYIRKHTATSLESLREVWSKVPLNLTHLELPNPRSWFSSNSHQFTRALAELHPDSVIQEISVGYYSSGNAGDDVYRVLPKVLHQFRGLRKFTITLRPQEFLFVFPSVFHIFAYIDCPGLEHLVIRGGGAEGIAYPDGRLPNLSFLEILPTSEWTDIEKNPSCRFGYSADDDFESLKTLIKMGISFRYGQRLDVLIEFISNGIADDTPMIKWLLMSECRIQCVNNGKDSVILDLCKFKPHIRDKVFRIIPALRLPYGVKLIIKKSPHNAFPSLHFLPHFIQHLAVRLGDINESLIEDILVSIPKLRSLNIATTISNRLFGNRVRFPSPVLCNDGHRDPVVYKLSLKGRWDVAEMENKNLHWDHVKKPNPTLPLLKLEKNINKIFRRYPEIHDVCFYFITSDFIPVPWFT